MNSSVSTASCSMAAFSLGVRGPGVRSCSVARDDADDLGGGVAGKVVETADETALALRMPLVVLISGRAGG